MNLRPVQPRGDRNRLVLPARWAKAEVDVD